MEEYSKQIQPHTEVTANIIKKNEPIQTNEISIEGKIKPLLDDYSIFLSHAFVDIATEYAEKDIDTFFELFYNRKQELNKFRTIAQDLYNTGDNILFIGNAGVGKSNFIYRLFHDTSMLEQYKLYPIMIDFRNSPTENRLQGIKLKFIAKMTEYFDQIGHSISAQVNNKIANIEDNIFIIQEAIWSKISTLTKLPACVLTKPCV